jgi:hypothetical protein
MKKFKTLLLLGFFTIFPCHLKSEIKYIILPASSLEAAFSFENGKPSDGFFNLFFGEQDSKDIYINSSFVVKKGIKPSERDAIIPHRAYLTGKSMLSFHQFFDFRSLKSWILVLFFSVILISVILNFNYLNNSLIQLSQYRFKNENAELKIIPFGRHRRNFLQLIFPASAFNWYPLLSGAFMGAAIFIGSIWNKYEMYRFLTHELFSFPVCCQLPIHWFLLTAILLCLASVFYWISESLFMAGIGAGLLRILILSVLNFMSFVVAFFLLAPMILATFWILFLKLFARTINKSINEQIGSS